MINAYSFGSIVVDKRKYNSDVIIYPDKVNSHWWRKTGHELCPEDIKEVLKEEPKTLVVGTGDPGLMKVLPETKRILQEKGIELIVHPTQESVRIYNEIYKQKKTVAALHLTC